MTIERMSKAEKTRLYIIERTAPVFNRKGYAGTSVSDLTEATGLTKGSIYGNFENKDEVALAAFEYNLGKVNGVISAAMARKRTAAGKLSAYAEVYSQFPLHTFPEGGCPILNTAVEADDTHPLLREKVLSSLLSWKSLLQSIIKDGIRNGEFRKDANAEEAALGIIALIEGAMMITKLTGRNRYWKLIMSSVKKIIDELK